ncbi:MAG: ABC transporter transmembrane domain-containing protein [Bacteroidota bacterium]
MNITLLLIFCQLTVQTIFSFMRVYLLTAAGERSLADMRKDVYSKLLTMPMPFFTEKRVGELSNRISSDCRRYRMPFHLRSLSFYAASSHSSSVCFLFLDQRETGSCYAGGGAHYCHISGGIWKAHP